MWVKKKEINKLENCDKYLLVDGEYEWEDTGPKTNSG
jgi:hypothetical protein